MVIEEGKRKCSCCGREANRAGPTMLTEMLAKVSRTEQIYLRGFVGDSEGTALADPDVSSTGAGFSVGGPRGPVVDAGTLDCARAANVG